MPTDTPYLMFYGLILLVGLGSLFFGDFRNRFTKMVQQLVIWLLIFAAATMAFQQWQDTGFGPRGAAVSTDGEDVVLRRAMDGHFYAELIVNGVPLEMVVDTGATNMVLSQEDAARIGIDLDRLTYFGRANTANGTVKTARVRLDEVRFGGRVDANVPATVNEGELHISLLGMSYLDRFARIEIAGNTLRLVQ